MSEALVIRMLLVAAVGAASAWFTGRLRAYAFAHDVIDVPNDRSSHSIATPRGGGMAIVVAVLAGWIGCALLGALSWGAFTGLVIGGAAVAAIGFADDHGHVARTWRLAAHVAAAAAVLLAVGNVPLSTVAAWPGGPAALFVAGALYLAWLVNLTNFMDGIDGIAAGEAISVAAGGALIAAGVGDGPVLPPLVLAAGAAGFLTWNWPPARIFMGDGGSGFLGLALGALALHAGTAAPALFWSWTILLGVFMVDATVTLLRRMAAGPDFYEPHRTHAYQKLARRLGAHRPVTIGVLAVNIGWLLPLAGLVATGRLPGPAGLAIAYLPLVVGAWHVGAGRPDAVPPSAPPSAATYN